MFIRQIGKILRGKATPAHIMMAAVLGSMLGFVPGFAHGPGLIVILILLLIILNANLVVAAIVGITAKVVSLPLLPFSFAVGRAMMDGPTQPLFEWLVNAPVFALFGLEHYATTGGVLIGFLFGLLCGILVIKAVGSFRRKMASLEEGSELFRRYATKWWAKLMAFVFIGGRHGKKTYAQLLEKKFGNPFRVIGVVFAVLVIVLAVVLQVYLSGPILTVTLRNGLERANGATVDIDSAEVDLKAGRMTISGLAIADPNALETEILRAVQLEADISGADLLRKRIRLDRVVVSDAMTGATRKIPGRIVGPPPKPSTPPESLPDEKTIDDYITQGKVWKERLAHIRKWLQKISPPKGKEPGKESIRQRIKRQIRDSGYASVKASHLVTQAPTLVVTELIAEGVKTAQLENEVLDIQANNLSTHPRLLAEGPRISVKARSGNLTAIADGEKNRLRFTYLGLPVDKISSSLSVGGASPINGGTMDLDLRGNWSSEGVGYIDLPLNVTLNQTNISIAGAGSSRVDKLTLPLGLRGPIDNPRITLEADVLADALAAAGAAELSKHVSGEAQKVIDKAKKEVGDEIGEEIGGKIDDAIGDIFSGSKKKKNDDS